jgi:D-alanyl-lipoteichoic acid acyltransferase DltB (MBOAT superfamily)
VLFQSAGFLFVFLPLFLATMALLPSGGARAVGLLIFSYLFYSGSEPLFIILIVVSSLTDFCVALLLHRTSGNTRRKLLLCTSLAVNLGLLAFYKYGAWIIPKLTPLLAPLNVPLPDEHFFSGFILPAGISFYTFQSLSYTIDVYRGHVAPERNLISFLNFVAYMPQLIAGPIERFGHLHPQLQVSTPGRSNPIGPPDSIASCSGSRRSS